MKLSRHLSKNVFLNAFLLVVILIVFFGIRAPGLGRYLTVDEARWLQRSANFYQAVTNGLWEETAQSPHPGIITQWAGAAGYFLVFPEYASIGRPDVRQVYLLSAMEDSGVNHMEVLAAGRLALIVINAVILAIAWPYAVKFLGQWAAGLAFLFIALDPFTVAHQRLLHLDGLLASLLLLSILAFLDFLSSGNLLSLGVSGIAAGMSWITKTPGWFIVPFIVGISIYWLIAERKKTAKRKIPIWLAVILWGACGMLAVFIFFPAFWVNPIGQFTNMWQFSVDQAEGEYGGYFFFNGTVYPSGDPGLLFYPVSFLWRSTPIVLLGLLPAIYFMFKLRKEDAQHEKKSDLLWTLVIFAITFGVFLCISIKKVDRYLLPSHLALMLVSGWGWVRVTSLMSHNALRWGSLGILLGFQWASGLGTFPYYLSYYNPILGGSAQAQQVMMIGQGEGLDQAVNYLKEVNATDIASFYNGTFNRLLYRQNVTVIPSRPNLTERQLEQMLAKEYVVIYVLQWQRHMPANLLDALAHLEPEYIVENNGIIYARIYHLNH